MWNKSGCMPDGIQEGDETSEEKRVKNTGSSGGPDFRMSDDERLRSGRLGGFPIIYGRILIKTETA